MIALHDALVSACEFKLLCSWWARRAEAGRPWGGLVVDLVGCCVVAYAGL